MPDQGISKTGVSGITVTVAGTDGRSESRKLPVGTEEYKIRFDFSDLPGVGSKDTVIPILGLFPDSPTSVKVEVIDDSSRKVFSFSTSITAAMETDTRDPLRDGYPRISISAAALSRMEPGMTLVSFNMGNNGIFAGRPFMIDASGAIRWVLRLEALGNWVSPVERLANGNLILGRGGAVYEYNMLGKRVHAWDISRYGFTQHHDIREIRKGPHAGNLLVAVDRINRDTVEDHVIEIDRDGRLVTTWDLRQVLDVSRSDILKNSSDWLHMNAVCYDPRDDSLVISGRNQGVAKVDRENRLRWILAPHRGWGPAGPSGDGPATAGRLLTAVSASGVPFPAGVQEGKANVDGGLTFDWPWGQHAIKLLPNGNYLLFDNGFNRQFAGSKTGFSRAVEYHIDETAGTVRQLWQYGAERGDAYYSSIISDTDSLPRTKNRLITSGSIHNPSKDACAYVTEVTYPGGTVVFESQIAFKSAHSDFAAGGWGNMDIVYRAERLPLYPCVPVGGR
jgi:arylsulfate sulfotransferase